MYVYVYNIYTYIYVCVYIYREREFFFSEIWDPRHVCGTQLVIYANQQIAKLLRMLEYKKIFVNYHYN